MIVRNKVLMIIKFIHFPTSLMSFHYSKSILFLKSKRLNTVDQPPRTIRSKNIKNDKDKQICNIKEAGGIYVADLENLSHGLF